MCPFGSVTRYQRLNINKIGSPVNEARTCIVWAGHERYSVASTV